jgi:hypothetical protein
MKALHGFDDAIVLEEVAGSSRIFCKNYVCGLEDLQGSQGDVS